MRGGLAVTIAFAIASMALEGNAQSGSGLVSSMVFRGEERIRIGRAEHVVLTYDKLHKEIGSDLRFDARSPLVGTKVVFVGRLDVLPDAWTKTADFVATSPRGFSDPLHGFIRLRTVDQPTIRAEPDGWDVAGCLLTIGPVCLDRARKQRAIDSARVMAGGRGIGRVARDHDCLDSASVGKCMVLIVGKIEKGSQSVDGFGVLVSDIYFLRPARDFEDDPPDTAMLVQYAIDVAGAIP